MMNGQLSPTHQNQFIDVMPEFVILFQAVKLVLDQLLPILSTSTAPLHHRGKNIRFKLKHWTNCVSRANLNPLDNCSALASVTNLHLCTYLAELEENHADNNRVICESTSQQEQLLQKKYNHAQRASWACCVLKFERQTHCASECLYSVRYVAARFRLIIIISWRKSQTGKGGQQIAWWQIEVERSRMNRMKL